MSIAARWWQFETWLRFLLYLELRAERGLAWTDLVPDKSQVLAERDDENAYMPSPDATNPLAYLDARRLMDVIARDDVWPLVSYALAKRERWNGLVD